MKNRITALLNEQKAISTDAASRWLDNYINEPDTNKADTAYLIYTKYKAEADIIAELLERIERGK